MSGRGDHVPLPAVSGTPTWGVPEIVGAPGLRNVPGATAAVATEVTTASVVPALASTVTRTEMLLRRSVGVGV